MPMTESNIVLLPSHRQSPVSASVERYEYADGEVTVSLRSDTGELLHYVTPAADLMRSIGLATKLIIENLTDFLSDILC